MSLFSRFPLSQAEFIQQAHLLGVKPDFRVGATVQRLVFLPIKPQQYSRNVSVPANHPVRIIRLGVTAYRLEAFIDSDDTPDYYAIVRTAVDNFTYFHNDSHLDAK